MMPHTPRPPQPADETTAEPTVPVGFDTDLAPTTTSPGTFVQGEHAPGGNR